MFGCALLTPCCRDTLAYQKRRMNLNESRVEAEVFLGDYWRRRSNPEEDFKLCRKCPQPPSQQCCYKLTCSKHNTV